jgi:CRISPR/Cas system CSM-associated protein Csm3 (group 7 of RAMP superfamily)
MSACLLDFRTSGVACASDVRYYTDTLSEQHRNAVRGGGAGHLAWIAANTCDVCKLFGSPVRSARLRSGEGLLLNPDAAAVQVRDGVVLDRDSHTAVKGLKYDYEAVAAGATFAVRFDLDNPTPAEEALFGAALFEWSAGASLGGFTSRGLGRFHLEEIEVRGVRFDDAGQRIRYLTRTSPEDRLTPLGGLREYFQDRITMAVRATTAGG